MRIKYLLFMIIVIIVFLMPNSGLGKCTSDVVVVVEEGQAAKEHNNNNNKRRINESLRYKVIAIGSVLVSGGIGVSLPILGRKFEALRAENDIFLMIKAFAAGVILATAFIHILPDAFISLTSPCLNHNPWAKFPFVGFVAMMSSILTLMVDSFATTTFYNKKKIHFDHHKQPPPPHDIDHQEINMDDIVERSDHHHHHVHTHAQAQSQSQAQAYNNIPPPGMGHSHDLIRQRIISQVLELGIVIHSVIIGVSLGASESPATIKPLLAALSFHQFFEGMGLGGCISQAKFKSVSTGIMAVFFSITTPVGIVIGIGVSSSYNGNTETALIVEGIFYSASAGILIYMALVDLLAPDFMNPRIQTNGRLQLGANISLLLGAGCMSIMAKWA